MKTYIGFGWIVDKITYLKLLNHIVIKERREKIEKHFHSINKNLWFLGDILDECDDKNPAFSLSNLKVVDNSFGFKYGVIFYECGLSVEEINENWSNPEYYVINVKE